MQSRRNSSHPLTVFAVVEEARGAFGWFVAIPQPFPCKELD